MAEKLRDLSQPIDVTLLDATVAAFYGTGSKEEVISSARLPARHLVDYLPRNDFRVYFGCSSFESIRPPLAKCKCCLFCSYVVRLGDGYDALVFSVHTYAI